MRRETRSRYLVALRVMIGRVLVAMAAGSKKVARVRPRTASPAAELRFHLPTFPFARL